IYAKGKLDGEEFKTNIIEIEDNNKKKPQLVELKFDKSEIDEYLKETNQIKLESKTFMEDYTKSLNKAYKLSDYKYIDKYIEKDTVLSSHMKNMVESKKQDKYSKPEFEKIDYNNDKITVTLKKTNQNKEDIKSKYELKYDKNDHTFKILSYSDI
ncbi:hypothetical protein ABH531_012210, partial [Staphylococcus warneri]